MLLAIDIFNSESVFFYNNSLVNELVVTSMRFQDIDLSDKSVLEIFLFQLYRFINYYFRALSFLLLIHR